MNLIDKLIVAKDTKYKDFLSRLVPNISKESILGIRTPELRKIAKDVYECDDRELFLNELPHKYYEENLIHFFVISMIKDFDQCIKRVEQFLPYVDCWPLSDQATPKSFKKNHKKLLPYIMKWINSNHVYKARFGIRMLMNEYLGDDFKEEYLKLVASIKGDDYYLKMMVAWFFATSLAKRYDETIPYFENHILDEWIYKKAIQKAIESYRVTDEHKKYLISIRQTKDIN